jgi:hypothetical protein
LSFQVFEVITTCIADYDKLDSNLGKEERSAADHLLYKLKKKRILVWEDWEDVFTVINTLIEHNAKLISNGWRKSGFIEMLEKLTAPHVHHRIRHEALRILLQIIDLSMPVEMDSTLTHLLVRTIDLPVYWTDVQYPCPLHLEHQYEEARAHIDNLPILTSQRQDSIVKRLSFKKKLSSLSGIQGRFTTAGRGQEGSGETHTTASTGEVLASSLELKEVFALWNTLLTFTVDGASRDGGLHRFKLFLEMIHCKWLRWIYPRKLEADLGIGVGAPTDAQFMEDLHIPHVIQDHLWTWFDKCCKNENVQAVFWSEPK